MADEDERVDWSALMNAHGLEPDADTRTPTVEPDPRRLVDPGETAPAARRSRLVHGVVALTALFSIAASVAVLIAISGGDEEPLAVAGHDPVASLARPAAFQQTTDGVAVVPSPDIHQEPEVVEPPPVAEATPPDPVIPAREGEEYARPPLVTPSPPEWEKERPQPPVVTSPPEKKRPVKRANAAGKDAAGKDAAGKDSATGTSEKEAAQPAAAEPADPNLPDEPDKDGVASAMKALEKDIAACAASAKLSGEVGIKMRIQPDGSVPWASAKVQNSPFQACLDRLFKKARMPKSQKGATIRQTVALP